MVFVIFLPIFVTNEFGLSKPYFCEFICPAGTLEGGIPLVLLNESLRQTIGFLFNWKIFLLLVMIISSVFIYRPFCSFYQYTIDKDKCTSCKLCSKSCHMEIKIYEDPKSIDCIRCGKCKKSCPHDAIKSGFKL